MVGEILKRLDVDAERIRIGGVEHAKVGRYAMTYYGMAGPSGPIERSIYRPLGKGHHNAATVDPIAVRGGLVEGAWLPATARAMAQRLAIGTSREEFAAFMRGEQDKWGKVLKEIQVKPE